MHGLFLDLRRIRCSEDRQIIFYLTFKNLESYKRYLLGNRE